jgi:hypothetical protein
MLLPLLASCHSRISERHHFASYQGDGVTPVNFYRLTVEGSTRFTSSRFLSGFYDERAVDLFFNELKPPPNSRLFGDDQKSPGTTDAVKALAPTPEHGTYVLILSSNADSVANAIGSFAESEVVADALSNIISSDQIRLKQESDANLAVQKAQAEALLTELSRTIADAGSAPDRAQARAGYLRVLAALARSLGHEGSFASFKEARAWFEREKGAARE